MSVSNYCPTNHWQGSIGSIWDGVMVGGRGLRQRDRGTLWGRESLKMPRDKRITDQYSRMDFVILKMAVRAVHSHLLRAQSDTPVHHNTPPRILSSLQPPWISEGISNVNQVSWFGLFWTAEPHPFPLEVAHSCMMRGLHVPGRWTQSETKISFIWMLFPVMGVWLGTEGLIDRGSGLINEGLSQ